MLLAILLDVGTAEVLGLPAAQPQNEQATVPSELPCLLSWGSAPLTLGPRCSLPGVRGAWRGDVVLWSPIVTRQAC